MLRVLIVDDQELVRAGFRVVLSAEDDLDVVGEARDGREAIELAARLHPDVVLMDVRMPVLDGIEATREICAREDAPRVVVLTTFDVDEYVYAALRAGASGFLLKDVKAAELVSAIRTVAAGDALLAPSVTRRLIGDFVQRVQLPPPPPGLADLTPREREVLDLVARGLSNAEIAAHFVVSEATVKTHVTRVLTKLGLRDRVQVVVLAHECGLVQPSGSVRQGSYAP